MVTILTILLVAGICFILGRSYEVMRCDQSVRFDYASAEEQGLRREQDHQDVVVFTQAQISPVYDPVVADAFHLPRPHLRVAPQPDVDAHFDELCRLGLVEQA